MKICDYLKEDHIFLDLKPGDKAQVLKQLMAALKKKGFISKEKVILDELFQRESLGSTGLEKGIAVPHALIDEIEEPFLALAVMKKEVDFEALDKRPTRIILLLLGDKRKPGFQLKILAHICRLVKETNFVEKTRKAKTAAEICSIFKEEEKKI
jgi:PTS system nitrogen regulatory IIA component